MLLKEGIKMKKKAQGISINTIIIAAIALIVLVVLIAVFTGRIGIWGQNLDDTTNPECKNDEREVKLSSACPITDAVLGKFSDVETGEVCCKKSSE
jgi:hypothetical protein